MRSTDGLLPCTRMCMQKKKNCQQRDCRKWIDFSIDYNCCLVSVYENGNMTLREVADRLGVSFARVKQIESAALKKIKKRMPSLRMFF